MQNRQISSIPIFISRLFRKSSGNGGLIVLSFCLLALLLGGCSNSKNSRSSTGSKVAKSSKSAGRVQDQVVDNARSFMGTPYKWGGTTRSGMDCSGLLFASFKPAGVEIPRTSAEQSKYGKKVSIYELKPGDLVFFSAKQGRGKITHVGMVTEVRGRKDVLFIHASSSLGVVENNLHSDYYRKIFIKARRPF